MARIPAKYMIGFLFFSSTPFQDVKIRSRAGQASTNLKSQPPSSRTPDLGRLGGQASTNLKSPHPLELPLALNVRRNWPLCEIQGKSIKKQPSLFWPSKIQPLWRHTSALSWHVCVVDRDRICEWLLCTNDWGNHTHASCQCHVSVILGVMSE